MRSMTGSGTGLATGSGGRIDVSVAAVNHRFLDARVRVPETLAALEPRLRELIAGRLSRGRVEMDLRTSSSVEAAPRLEVDRQTLRALRELFASLAEEGLVDRQELGAGDILRVPQLVRLGVEAPGWGAEDLEVVLAAATRALDELVGAREAEGQRLGQAIGERLSAFRELVARVSARRGELQAELLANLRRRVSSLLDGREVAEERLAQEVALLAERSDVGEELDRLAAHLDHFDELLAADGAVGKRLDFLCQELLREVNTLGSKSRDAATTREVLEAKHLCEQLREQVQNIE